MLRVQEKAHPPNTYFSLYSKIIMIIFKKLDRSHDSYKK